MFLPATCPGCGAMGAAPCPACAAALVAVRPSAPPSGIDGWQAAFSYEGAGRELMARLKYRNNRSALQWLAAAMAALVDPSALDVVTWAPTSTQRRWARGFDQAELLARAVARRLGCPCRRCLRREDGPPQTGRSREVRLLGPRLRAVGPVAPRVLVIDDVATTGATLASAARALRDAGAIEVWALTAARTPSRRLALPSTPHPTSQED